MRQTTRNIALGLLAMTILTSSCTTSKSLYKDALKYEENGLDEEAVRSLQQSLSRNINNIDARLSLEKVGKRVLNKKLDDFNRHAMLKDYGGAVSRYRVVDFYVGELRRYRVNLSIPAHYKQTYHMVKETHLGNLYKDGLTAMNAERFSTAEDIFDRILDIDEGYKDVSMLREGAECEPLYRQAMAAFESQDYKNAYWLFDRCVRTGDYKDAKEYRAVSVKLGQVTIAMTPFENKTSFSNSEDMMEAHALDALLDINDPFLKVIERADLEQIIAEQNLGLSGTIDEATATELGQITGAKTILIGRVMDYQVMSGRPAREKKKGFVSYQATVKAENGNSSKVTRYRPANYHVISDERSVSISFHYKVIDVRTAQVIASDIINRVERDEVNYAEFDGDAKKLMPSKSGKVNMANSARGELRSLLNSRTNIRQTSELSDELLDGVARSMAAGIAAAL